MAGGLATRCTACGTVFRVVADQLRVSEGWVRCGRCQTVFNALEELIDLDTGEPRQAGDAAVLVDDGPGPLHLSDAGANVNAGAAGPPTPDAAPAEPVEAHAALALAAMHHGAAAGAALPPPPDATAAAPEADLVATRDDALAVVGQVAPGFVRDADRAARWRRPGVRLALSFVGLLAALGLVAQALFTYRDLAAARYPALAPLLAQGCAWLGCTVEPPRAIAALSVESSGLLRVERSALYKLQVTLRNGAGIDVAVPALDLSLTDAQGRLVSRRVLQAAELGVKGGTIAAGRELSAQVTLQALGDAASGTGIAGYTIELFYP
jgi:predicted Zn finger-like uncharacterized protein